MAGRSIRTFTVLPYLPERLQALHQLAHNMWWCWNHEAVSLFRRLDDDLFDAVENSPVKLLGAVDQNRLEQLLKDDGFLVHMDRVEEALNTYMTGPTWFQETYPTANDFRVAYRSTCWTPTLPRTTQKTGRSPAGFTAATTICASARK